jgi:26S proteasome regulatory subunit N10
MKKNNVSVDFVAFGALSSEDTRKLEAFNENVKSADGSYLAVISPGPHLLSDQLVATPIMGGKQQDGGPVGAGAGVGGEARGAAFNEFDADPELALALRLSMEEHKARQERENKAMEGAKKESLEGIPEEGGESQPLLDRNGEPSGSSDVKDEDQRGGDEDKMDTA